MLSYILHKKNREATKHETWNCVDQILLEKLAVITLNKKYATLFMTSKHSLLFAQDLPKPTINASHSLRPYSFKIHFNIILFSLLFQVCHVNGSYTLLGNLGGCVSWRFQNKYAYSFLVFLSLFYSSAYLSSLYTHPCNRRWKIIWSSGGRASIKIHIIKQTGYTNFWNLFME